MKTCPYCAEQIQDAAIVCRYCSRDIVNLPVVSVAESTGHNIINGKCTKCGCSEGFIERFSPKCTKIDMGTTVKPALRDNAVKCPKCKSVSVTSQKTGFGLGKSVVGGLALGPAGLLAGFLGSKKVDITCLKCGHRWKPSAKK